MLTLALRALWWRRSASLAVLATASIAVLAACIGPLWWRAAEESVVRTTLAESSIERITVTATSEGRMHSAMAGARAVTTFPDEIDPYFGAPAVTIASAQMTVLAGEGARAVGTLRSRDDQCDLLDITGSCPSAVDEVLLSGRSASALGVTVGDTIHIPALDAEPVVAGTGDPFPSRLTISGVYEPPGGPGPDRFGHQFFDFRPPTPGLRDSTPGRLDAMFVTADLLAGLSTNLVQVTSDRALLSGRVDAAEFDHVLASLTAHVAEHRRTTPDTTIESGLFGVGEELASQREVLRNGSMLVTAQLLFLAWFAMAAIVTSTSESLATEAGLAKLRGLRARSIIAHSMTGPMILLVLSVPVGMALALAVLRVAARRYFTADTPVVWSWPASAALAIALAGTGSAIVLASRRALRQPVNDQLRRVWPTPSSRQLITVEAIVVTLAAVGVYQLVSLGGGATDSGIGLATPGLVAVAAGLVAGRLIVGGAHIQARRTRRRQQLASYLGSRQLARRHGLTRVAVLVAVAVGLSTFAVEAWSLARSYRASQAAMTLGAHTVVNVETTGPLALMRAVERADPSGTQAMAVVFDGDRHIPPARRLVAVDSRRLAAVAAWQPSWADEPVSVLAANLRPDDTAPLEVFGTHWRLAADSSLVTGTVAPALLARVRTADDVATVLPLGQLAHGRSILESEHPECTAGCRLIELVFARPPGAIGHVGATVGLTGLTVDGRSAGPSFTDPAAWRPGVWKSALEDTADIDPEHGVLTVSFLSEIIETPSIVRADVPVLTPALLTSEVVPDPIAAESPVSRTGLDGAAVLTSSAGTADVLPVVGRMGALIDLETASLQAGDPVLGDLTYQVWLSPAASPSIVGSLADAGITVNSTSTSADRRAALDREGPALALLLLTVSTGIALLIAATAALVAVLAGAMRRGYELAALRTVGVRLPVLRRAAWLEFTVLLGTGVLAGVAAGLGTARLARDVVPVSVDPAAGPPLPTGMSWTLAVLVATGAAAVMGLVAWLGVRRLVAVSQPATLREVQA